MSGVTLLEGAEAREWVDRTAGPAAPAVPEERLREILDRVRREGDPALLALGMELDGVRPRSLRVPTERLRQALEALPAGRREALERARRNVARFHEAQRRREPPVAVEPGVRAWREFRPLDRVGLYVPGGRAAYPSSLLMTGVPARLAGCRHVVACSPPGPDGLPHPAVMAAAALTGVDALYAVGGAQAVAALAFGTETVPRVDKVFGPGGAWVNAAKLALFDVVAVDLPAGPSEVLVWADGEADPDWVAAELLAQAEHGPDSLCVGLLPDRLIAERVAERVAGRCVLLVCPKAAEAAEWVEALAPEHLVLMRRDAARRAARVRNAGAVFLGAWSSVALGDYAAGTNHVLPTGRRARGAGGLGLDDFGRWVQFLEVDPRGAAALAPAVAELAAWEGLPAHAAAARARAAAAGEERAGPSVTGSSAAEAGDGVAGLGGGGDNVPGDAARRMVRPHLLAAEPYVTARSRGATGILLDANENAFGPLAPELGPELHRYPDPRAGELRSALARWLRIPAERLWIGNGSDEALDLLIRSVAAEGGRAVLASPSYGVYRARAQVNRAEPVEVPLDAAFDLDVKETSRRARTGDLVLLCSPNNPTGNLLDPERIRALAARTEALVVVDEAYVEFARAAPGGNTAGELTAGERPAGERAEGPSLVRQAGELPNLAVVRTFSKAWGLAGARVGYLVAHPRLVRVLDAAGLPYPLSAPAARAARLALGRAADMRARCRRIRAERERVAAELRARGLRVLPSEANFLCFFVSRPRAVHRRLIEEHGVVVRDRSGLPRLAGALRVTVGTPEENDRFLDGLAAALPEAEREREEVDTCG